MHLLFVDESGTPASADATQPRYFVMGGVVVPEGVWQSLRDALLGLKLRRKIRGEIKWRYFAPANNEARNPMRGLEQDERDAIRREIYSAMTKHSGVTSLAVVVSHSAAYSMPSVNSASDIYHLAFKALTERFQYHLAGLSRHIGTKQLGLVVADQRNSGDDRMLRQAHEKLLHASGKNITDYANFVEGLFVQPSNLSIGIQLADMVAGAVWRKFERDDPTFFDLAESTFRRDARGCIEGYGLVRQPKRGWK